HLYFSDYSSPPSPPSSPTRRSSDLECQAPPYPVRSVHLLLHQGRMNLLRHEEIQSLAKAIRISTLQMVHRAGASHIGTCLSAVEDRKSTRLNSSHVKISYAVFCLKK